jgi:hypothetical protein
MIDKRPRHEGKGRQARQPEQPSDADRTADDELNEALKGTFPGSDPVALESPLVSRAPKSTRS